MASLPSFPNGRSVLLLGVLAALAALGACRSGDDSSPSVLGAVFGVEDAPTTPYSIGRVPDPMVRPGDRVVGDAANNPGQCIFRRPSGVRFRANCPEGYAIGDAN